MASLQEAVYKIHGDSLIQSNAKIHLHYLFTLYTSAQSPQQLFFFKIL